MNNRIWFVSTQEFLRDGYYAALFMLLPFISKDIGISLSQAGFLQAVTSSIALFIALPTGVLAEKCGGLKIITYGVFIYGLAFLGLPLVTSYYQLFALYLVAGFGFAMYATLVSGILAAFTETKNRGQTLGVVMAIGDVGKMCLSTLVPILIGLWSWKVVGFSLGLVALLVFCFSALFTFGLNKAAKIKTKSTKPITFKELFKHKLYMQTVLASVIDAFASHPLFVLLPFLLVSKNYELASVGLFTGIYYFGNIVSRIFFGKLVDKFGSAQIFILCEFLMAIMMVGLVLATNPILIGIACILLGLVSEGTDPAVQAMTAESIENEGGFEKAFSLKSSFNNIARTTSPLLLGFIADKFGLDVSFYVMAGLVLAASIPAATFRRARNNHT